VLLVLVAVCIQGCEPGADGPARKIQPFEKNAWNEGRQKSPGLNVSPWMAGDLLTNHLVRGMSLADVTNLLGHPEIRSSAGAVTHIRGEFLVQTVYVYQPGSHNGWLVHGTNPVVLFFGNRGNLVEWSPAYPFIEPVSAKESMATRETTSKGGLHIGNHRFAGSTTQFDNLLGTPNEIRTEYQLDYYLGKQTRFAEDDVFLELHFDKDKKLARKAYSEH
jgi:hypothetical protein